MLVIQPIPRQPAQFDETLIDRAVQSGPIASVWHAKQGLVVPRTYQQRDDFVAVCSRFAQRGWPVTVRLSGGGVVPQGRGIINVSLAYPVDGLPLNSSDAVYQLICQTLQDAIGQLGIVTQPQAVAGSFCDGRYNLACGQGDTAKKVVGTAQLWRRIKQGDGIVQIVLVHALVLAAIDVGEVTGLANQLEQELGSDKRYDSARMASLHQYQLGARYDKEQFVQLLSDTLVDSLESLTL